MTAEGQKRVELLGRRLRKLRKDRKLSPADVASATGIDAQDLKRIERGETRVGLETLFRLVATFEVDPRELESLVEEERSRVPERERFRRELPG